MGQTARVVRRRAPAAALAGLLAAAGLLVPAYADDDPEPVPTRLYLVTLEGPGTAGHRGPRSPVEVVDRMLTEQDEVLGRVGAGEPVYRWTTALNGVAVELDRGQAAALAADPRVALVEPNRVRPLAAAASPRAAGGPAAATSPTRTRPAPATALRGAGTVIAFVDTGVDPDSPALSQVAALGAPPERFAGGCADAPAETSWDSDDCTEKVVGARYFVAGFGAHRLRATEVLSPEDTHGHGTQMASIAAGTAGLAVRVDGHRLGRFSGVAPRARVAAYKACWSAPDPDDDGCATADLVAAIDRATADRVDVLSLSVGGPAAIDTVERALLGAVEAGVVVTAAAGNRGSASYAAHPAPWVVTVGATTGPERAGEVVARGVRLRGAMAATEPVGPARLVVAARVPAPGATRAEARVCAASALDASAVAGAVVLCERGEVARVEKSRTVGLADGVGMVLVNRRPGSTDADLHSVPTVHLSDDDGRTLRRWAADRARPRVRLVAHGPERGATKVARFSSSGDPTSPYLNPNVVARGTGVVAAVPGGWSLISGTSAAAAEVSGVAAVLRALPGASAAEVRSALVTSAAPLGDDALAAGAGRARVAGLPPLSYLVAPPHFRRWLEGRRSDLDVPHAVLGGGRQEASRTVTNTSGRRLELHAQATGFAGSVTVRPTVASLAPGESVRFRVSVAAAARGTDAGAVVWWTGAGDAARLPVVVTR